LLLAIRQKQKMQVTAVSFNKRGDKIYTGDAKGFVTIIGSVALNVRSLLRYFSSIERFEDIFASSFSALALSLPVDRALLPHPRR